MFARQDNTVPKELSSQSYVQKARIVKSPAVFHQKYQFAYLVQREIIAQILDNRIDPINHVLKDFIATSARRYQILLIKPTQIHVQ